jgi:hypothetical protein
MQLEDLLGEIQTHRANLFHGWLPFELVANTQLWHIDAAKGAIHPIIASEAKQSRTVARSGLLRRSAPRNDEQQVT